MTFHSSSDNRLSSIASIRNGVPSERQDEELSFIQNLKEGDTVKYQSNTHGTDMLAKVLSIIYEDGKITRIDLDVKKKANMCRISMLKREEMEAGLMQSGAAPMRETHIPTSHVNAARGGQSMGHPAGGRPWGEKFVSLVENHRGPLDDSPASLASAPTSKAESPDYVERKFAQGQKVKYFSSSYNKYIDAKVLDVRADGTYNLDIKKGAKEEHMKATDEEDLQAAVSSTTNVRPHQEKHQPSSSPGQEQCQQPGQQQTSQSAGNDAARTANPGAGLYSSRQAAAFMPEYSPSYSSSSLMASGVADAAADCSNDLQRHRPAAPSREVSSLSSQTGEARSDAAVPRRALAPPFFMGVGTEWLRPVVPAIPSSQRSSFAAQACASSSAPDRGSALAADLRIGAGGFEPTEAPLRSQILARLGFTNDATLEKMTGFSGGLNQGIWFVTGSRAGSYEELVLKLVRCSRIAPNVPTEAENLEKLKVEHPKLVSESLVAFPIKILSVADANGCKCNDLIVMRKVPGERLAELFCRKYYGKQEEHLFQICEEIGRLLADFHRRYDNMQHGDFQPSNVFYDEASDTIAFIDIGGMGIPTVDNDVSHFRQAMNLLANAYGPTLHTSCIQAFDRGYQKFPA
eukprot:TRINITY_DN410_c0_g2_i1.p1 TRINITY_DN410_c0_g2~~TRINITY_DN410_c0_g2_i1.p1  ORF type:complete len:631 (-),score=111.78 TRINITY_DN410_c0_g2_i1:154-2046(-)